MTQCVPQFNGLNGRRLSEMDPSWNNLNYNTFLLKKLNGLLVEEATAVVAVGQLKTLAQIFADKSAKEEESRRQLQSQHEEEAIEEQWLLLLNNVVNNRVAESVQSTPTCISQLKVRQLSYTFIFLTSEKVGFFRAGRFTRPRPPREVPGSNPTTSHSFFLSILFNLVEFSHSTLLH